MTTVIADSTRLIFLAVIGKFDLLRALFGRIIIPTAVVSTVPILPDFRR